MYSCNLNFDSSLASRSSCRCPGSTCRAVAPVHDSKRLRRTCSRPQTHPHIDCR